MFWARDNQKPPELSGIEYHTWLLLAGRGFGKTWTGSNYVNWAAETGRAKRIGLIARTAADVRDVVVEGDSGILETAKPGFKPIYEPSKRRITWPNGATATTFSADEPNLLRGPNLDLVWGDELASWKHEEAYSNAMLCLRGGDNPKAIFTTTPKPVKLVTDLINDQKVLVTSGSTFDNQANLAGAFIEHITAKYKGSRLGLQELYAQILTDTPGALWTLGRIEELRVRTVPPLPRIVIGVDPSASDNSNSAETGIIVAGKSALDHFYTLDDCSIQGTPHVWGSAVVAAFHKWQASAVVVETNQGGDMVASTIRSVEGGKNIPIIEIHASVGKYTRAEPVSVLMSRGVHHHVGYFGDLESQMCTYVPGNKSPDRLDAMVYALLELSGLLRKVGAPMKQGSYL